MKDVVKNLFLVISVLALAVTSSNVSAGNGNGGGKPPKDPPSGGGNTIPPGKVTDLTAGQPGFNTIPVTWTATANDDYDASSGPARQYIFRFSLDGPITEADFDAYNWVDNGGPWGEEPGTIQSIVLADREFEPDMTYFVAVQATDFADNSSLVSNIQVTTEPFPGTSWSIEVVDACLYYANDFDYDFSGNPMFVYNENCSGQTLTKLARWDGMKFVTEVIDIAVEGTSFFATDLAGEPTMIGYEKGKLKFYRLEGSSWKAELIERGRTHGAHLAYSEDGFPAVAYGMSARNGDGSCWLARFNGTTWDKQVVDPSTRCHDPRLAFDPDGNPALSYLDDLESDPFIDWVDTLKFAYWDGAAWNVEKADQPPGHHAGGPSVAYDPVREGFSAAYHISPWTYWPDGRIEHGPSRARFCERAADDDWNCEDLQTEGAGSLVFDTDGTAYVVTAPYPYTAAVATRAPGSVTWVEEMIDWGAGASSIKLSPGGMPGISLDRYKRPNPNQTSLNFARPIPLIP